MNDSSNSSAATSAASVSDQASLVGGYQDALQNISFHLKMAQGELLEALERKATTDGHFFISERDVDHCLRMMRLVEDYAVSVRSGR